MQDFQLFISNHYILASSVLVLFMGILGIELLRNKRSTTNISPQDAIHLINRQNATVIDLRSPSSFQTGHIINAVSLSTTDLVAPFKKLLRFRQKPIILIADTETECQKFTTLLNKEGYNACSISGGLRVWTSANLPLVKE